MMDEPGPSSKPTYPIFINISGTTFETRTGTLEKYPFTLLGNSTSRSGYFCPDRNEYYFDRHRESFESILFFYQSSGKLYRPTDIALSRFIKECEFYRLPEWSIRSMKMKEAGDLYEHKRKIAYVKTLVPTTNREAIWYFMEHPSSSTLARWFSYFYVFLLFISITINCLVTVKSVNQRGVKDVLAIFDVIVNTYFLGEFICRFVITPCRGDFIKHGSTWVDLFALIPFLSYLCNPGTAEIVFLKPFQVFRVIRVFRLSKIFPAFNVTAIVLRSSLEDIKLFMTSLTVFVVFAGAIAFNLEQVNIETYFVSIPESMYWAVQTCVTLGYGDILPATEIGKLFASFFIFFSIPVLSIPVMSVIVKFSKCYDVFTDDELIYEKEAKSRR